MTFRCEFCQRDFLKETTLSVHMCEQKRRFREKDERGVQLGLQAFLKFYETLQGSSRLKTWDDFAQSSYYRAFVRFGRYCVNTRTINPARFMEWLLKHNKKIDRWASDQTYTEYLLDYLRVESVEDALARALEWALDWTGQSAAPAHDSLRYGNPNLICHAVISGRISPWVLYNCDSGREFLAGLDQSMTAAIWPYIDSDFWSRKFREYPADREYAESMLTQAGW
jgi:hypothetical protein